MAPEQARGESDVDHRTDIYAVGAILYVCLSGRRPYTGTAVGILTAVVTGRPDPLRRLCPNLPEALYGIVETAMSPDRRLRFQSVLPMRDALAAVAGAVAGPGVPSGAIAEHPAAPPVLPSARHVATSLRPVQVVPPTPASHIPSAPSPPSAPPPGASITAPLVAGPLPSRQPAHRRWSLAAIAAGAVFLAAGGLLVGRLTTPGPDAGSPGSPPPGPRPAAAAVPSGAAGPDAASVSLPPVSPPVGPPSSAEVAPLTDDVTATVLQSRLDRARAASAAGDPAGALGTYVSLLNRAFLVVGAPRSRTARVVADAALDAVALETSLLLSQPAAGPDAAPFAILRDPAFLTALEVSSELMASPDPEVRQCALVRHAALCEGVAQAMAEPGVGLPSPREEIARDYLRFAHDDYASAIDLAGAERGPCAGEARERASRLEEQLRDGGDDGDGGTAAPPAAAADPAPAVRRGGPSDASSRPPADAAAAGRTAEDRTRPESDEIIEEETVDDRARALLADRSGAIAACFGDEPATVACTAMLDGQGGRMVRGHVSVQWNIESPLHQCRQKLECVAQAVHDIVFPRFDGPRREVSRTYRVRGGVDSPPQYGRCADMFFP